MSLRSNKGGGREAERCELGRQALALNEDVWALRLVEGEERDLPCGHLDALPHLGDPLLIIADEAVVVILPAEDVTGDERELILPRLPVPGHDHRRRDLLQTVVRIRGMLAREAEPAGDDEIGVGGDDRLEIESVVAPRQELRALSLCLLIPELRVLSVGVCHLRGRRDDRLVDVVEVAGEGVVEHDDPLRIDGDFDRTLGGRHRARLRRPRVRTRARRPAGAEKDKGTGESGSGDSAAKGRTGQWRHARPLRTATIGNIAKANQT